MSETFRDSKDDFDPNANVDPEQKIVPEQRINECGKGTISTDNASTIIDNGNNEADDDKIAEVLNTIVGTLVPEQQDLYSTLPQTTLRPLASQTTMAMPSSVSVRPRGIETESEAATARESLDQSQTPSDPDYVTLRLLGEGGMGTVHLARQVALGRAVAVKQIQAEQRQKQSVQNEFLHEAVLTGRLEHPNIVPIYEVGKSPKGDLFYSMKNIKGKAWSDTIGTLSLDENLEILLNVCDAIAFAHAEGVIHRDLKPQNVMTGGFGEVLVLDWGLALVMGPDTKVTSFAGTPALSAPEMINPPFDVGLHSDIYLLGANLFLILAGKPPHGGASAWECLRAVSENKIETPDQDRIRRLDPSGELMEVALRAMATKVEDRYQSVTDFQTAVRDLRSHHESLELSSRAQQSLESAQSTGDHTHYSRAVFGFEEASKLWDGNEDAKEGIHKARLLWALCAEDQGNFDLAISLLDDSNSEQREILKRVTAAHKARDTQKNHARRLRQFSVAAGIVMLLGAVGFAIYQKRVTAALAVEKQKTELARGRAEDGRAAAQKAEGEAREAEALAETEAQRARDSEAAAKFQLANARWEANRAGEARDLLHQILPEYRDNFEWHYCNRRFQGSDVTCYGHTSDVYAVAFAPDASRVFSSCGNGEIKLWDATTGQELGTLDANKGGVLAIAVNSDGTRLASAGPNKTIWLWDTEAGEVIRTMAGHAATVRCVKFSPTGDRIVSASDDKTVMLWDARSGEQITTIKGHTAAVLGVAFSPDGERLASVGRDRLIRVWNARSGEQITQLSKHFLDVLSVAFSPDGTRLIASAYGYASLWDAQTWQFIAETGAHDRHVHCVAFSPDGARFATGGDDATIKLWDSRSGMIIKTLAGHAQPVQAVAFSPDGARLVSGSRDRTVKLWDARDGSELTRRGPSQGSAIAFSKDGKQLASGVSDGTFFLRDAHTSEVRFTIHGHRSYVGGLSFSPDGSRIASGGWDTMVRLWNTKSGKKVAEWKGHPDRIRWLAFSPDGTRLATSCWDGTAKLWDVNSLKETATLKGHRAGVYCVAFSPDGARLATSSLDRTVKLWNVATGKEIRTFRGHVGGVCSVAFCPRGERLVSGGYDTKARIWDVASGKQLATADIRLGNVWGITFSPDGKRFAAVGSDPKVALYDAASGQEIVTLSTRVGGIQSVTFSHDGTRLAVCSHPGSVWIFDALREQETTFLSGHTDTIGRVTFSADGLRVYSESKNEKLVWDVAKRVTIPDATWEPPQTATHTSPDGRWFVTNESKNVVLVDLEYKNAPHESGYRKAKASFQPLWHDHQAAAARDAKDWYATVFHRALLVKQGPDPTALYGVLQWRFQQLQSQFEQKELDIESYLPMVVKESLRRVNEWTNSSFEEPRIRKGAYEFQEAIPRWNTTERMFEIWSTGFQGVTAHEGNQFVELNANEDGTLYQEASGIDRGAEIEFSFAHRGRNGEDTLKLTITDLGADNVAGGGDDKVLFAKEYTTGKDAWAVYDSTTEPRIQALGNRVRFAFTSVKATGLAGEGNFLDSVEFGVGVVSAKREAPVAAKRHASGGNRAEIADLGPPTSDPKLQPLGMPLTLFENAERAYLEGEYPQAHQLLSDAWKNALPGTEKWKRYQAATAPMLSQTGINAGHPPCYAALRMLTECAEWRMRQAQREQQDEPIPLQLTVLAVTRGKGNVPVNLDELSSQAGEERGFQLSEALLAENHQVINESLWLFQEYISAITDGRLKVDTRVIELDTSVALRAREIDMAGRKVGEAGLADLGSIWNSVDSQTRDSTDWWWVLYPSAVPTGSQDFAGKEFITGGMSVGPDGQSPCFVVDDLWLVRKPPHLGHGKYSSQERRIYMPQWLQHEFFHHLYRCYPDFRLEATSHQWFDRKSWPAEFQGIFEADYYAQSLHKRIQPHGKPPLHVKLQHSSPPKTLFAELKLADIAGDYELQPRLNDWHAGKITVVSASDGKLKWTNDAGVSWGLTFDRENGLLRTEKGSPYYDSDPIRRRAFRLLGERESDSGDWSGKVIGFQFGNGNYYRKP